MPATEVGQSVRPEIVENYRDFEPPANFRKITQELLDSVPQKYLDGLITIILTNRAALSRNQRRQKLWSRRSKVAMAHCLGTYHHATRSSNAAFVRYAVIEDVLYHEIGHHIHAVHKPVFEGRENVAEDWEARLGERFFKARYWYLMPVLYPIAISRRLAKRIKKKA